MPDEKYNENGSLPLFPNKKPSDKLMPGENEGEFEESAVCVNSQDQTAGLEDILHELGSPGKFTVLQLVLNFMCVYCLSFSALVYVFIGYIPPHKCATLANETEVLNDYGLVNDTSASFHYQKCSIDLWTNVTGRLEQVAAMRCLNGMDYGGQQHISFVTEWNFVCENRTGFTEFVQTVMMIGQGVGAVLSTSVADRVGRKPVFILCNLCMFLVGLGGVFSPNIYVFLAVRFFTGFFQQGTGLAGFTLLMELTVPEHRRYVGVLGGTNWNISMVMLALTAYLMRDASWRSMQLVTALMALNALIYPFLLVESPRWLIANKKYDQALAVLKRACRMNGKDFSKVQKLFNRKIRSVENGLSQPSEQQPDSEKYNVLDILRHKSLLKSSLVIWLTWITCSITYYALVLASSSLAGNRHLNFFLMALVDFPGDLLIILVLDRIGRRFLAMLSLGITGSGLLTASLLMAYGVSGLERTLTTVFSLVGKFGIGVCFSCLFIFTPELFPTNLRSAGLGMCSSVSRFGGMMAPYSRVLADVVLWGPGAIFSGMCFLSGLLFINLPETKGRSLPATIHELKRWNSGKGEQKTQKPLARDMEIEITPTEPSINGEKELIG